MTSPQSGLPHSVVPNENAFSGHHNDKLQEAAPIVSLNSSVESLVDKIEFHPNDRAALKKRPLDFGTETDLKPSSPTKAFTPRLVSTPTRDSGMIRSPVSTISTPAPKKINPSTPIASRQPSGISQQRMFQSSFSVGLGTYNTHKKNSSPQFNRKEEVNTGIYTATYSGVAVFEMMVNGIAVMRRRNDSSLNATQILKVSGIDKSKRTKILEREILTGVHEKVQGGYGKYQGTWIPFERGTDLCKQYSVYDLLFPLLDFNETNPGMENTPTKEQALAASRKRVNEANSLSLSSRSASVLTFNSPIQVSGSFNAPLSHHANEAMHSLGNATRMERSPPGVIHATHRDDSFRSDIPVDTPVTPEGPERKKVKTEVEESTFIPDDLFEIDESSIPSSSVPLEPLEAICTSAFENSKALITQIFVNSDASTLADAFGGEDHLRSIVLDVPIDDLQHTALHWASALGRISLVKELIHYGANILRANHSGESVLVRAVLVTNNSDASSFPQLLDLLYPAIPLVDKVGRSILHHIALTAGIKGRSDASKYYLSCVLEWIVKRGSKNKTGRLSLGGFIREIVNAQDKNGDTALNIAARVDNQNIAQQLLEVGADPNIPNRAGLKPVDFGIHVSELSVQNLDVAHAVSNTSVATGISDGDKLEKAADECKEERSEIFRVVSSLVAEVESTFNAEHKAGNEEISRLHEELHESNKLLEGNRTRLEKLKECADSISRNKQRVDNLERAIEEEDRNFRQEEARQGHRGTTINYDSEFNPDQPFIMRSLQKVYDRARANNNSSSIQIRDVLISELRKSPSHFTDIPAKSFLRARIRAYQINEGRLKTFANELRDRSADLEQKFRRIVAQCTSIQESQVDSLLEGLVQAVESDPSEMDLTRVSGFLRKVDDGLSF